MLEASIACCFVMMINRAVRIGEHMSKEAVLLISQWLLNYVFLVRGPGMLGKQSRPPLVLFIIIYQNNQPGFLCLYLSWSYSSAVIMSDNIFGKSDYHQTRHVKNAERTATPKQPTAYSAYCFAIKDSNMRIALICRKIENIQVINKTFVSC